MLARIPIITVRTTDTMNAVSVLKHLLGSDPVKWPGATKLMEEHQTYYSIPGGTLTGIDTLCYRKLVDAECCLVIINPEEPISVAFDAGEMPVPKELVEKALKSIVGDDDDISKLARAVSGLTLKQMAEAIRLAQAKDGALTVRGLMSMRSVMAGKVQGLHPVTTNYEFYQPPKKLVDWVAVNKPYFSNCPDERLVPRGILFHGAPGVGKTQASKFIAREFGVPLYRLDVSGSLGKYVGESENNLSRVLAMVDQEAPCLLLMDEVEKVFKDRDDGGVTARLLSQVLWWLQERRGRVLTVMTTNDIGALPKELYRAGRIDLTMEMERLHLTQAVGFGLMVLGQFVASPSLDQRDTVQAEIVTMVSAAQGKLVAHVDVIELVHFLVKSKQWVSFKSKGVEDEQ